MISLLNSEKYYLHKNHRLQPPPYKPPHEQRDTGSRKRSFHTKQKYSRHLLAYSIITILVYLCWLPDFIVALKDVSVTIPQAVKRGSNAMLTCNYDMENDTLYSVKWYKGRREFYRYTPKENPAMKVFPSQSGLNVERNLSNQSHVVLLAVPLNISGKFTCEISVEAPSFQTAMVSGEMEVVELPEEQATVTGIQPRYRIGDLVDGNCSIKYSKPAANLTWTINGIVVPPHHIKTYQIEKYEETNLESVMSAIHFMVTTQHFIKGQMRLKCTASIFDIFQEEIESIIEEDRPRIMASGQSYPPDHGYDPHGDSDGYEHNESYLTYFSAPKSSAPRSTEFIFTKLLNCLKQKTFALFDIKSYVLESQLTTTLVNNMRNYFQQINQYDISSIYSQLKQPVLRKYITSVMATLLMADMLRKIARKIFQKIITFTLTAKEPVTLNCTESIKEVIRQTKYNFQVISLWHKKQYRVKKEPQRERAIFYQNANDDDCQAKCDQLLQQQDKHCKVVANQNVFNESFFSNDTNITTIEKNKSAFTRTLRAIDDYQHQMTQTLAVARLLSPYKCIHTMPPSFTSLLPDSSSSLSKFPSWSSSSSSSSASVSALSSSLLPSLLSSTTLADRKTYAHDSFPLYTLGASKSNNAKYMSKDQTLLMTFTLTAAMTSTTLLLASLSTCATTASALALLISPKQCIYKTSLSSSSPLTSSASVGALVLESKLLETSVVSSFEISKPSPLSLSFPLTILFAGNNYLMAFIGEFLLHQC